LKNQEKVVKASVAHRGQPDPAQLAFLATEDDERRPEDASAFEEEFSLSSQMDGIMELSTLKRTFRGLKATLA
jgi:hypothetical protein